MLDEITDREVSILDLILLLTVLEIRESEMCFNGFKMEVMTSGVALGQPVSTN